MQRNRHCALEMNELAINFDMVALVWLRAEICADATVDNDASRYDQFVTLATGADAGCSEKTVQAHEEVERLSR